MKNTSFSFRREPFRSFNAFAVDVLTVVELLPYISFLYLQLEPVFSSQVLDRIFSPVAIKSVFVQDKTL